MHARTRARARTHTHLVSGDKDPSEDAPWCVLCDNLVSGLSSLSYAIIFHSWRLFLAFLTFFTSRVVPSIRFCSWRPRRKASVPRQREGKERVSAVGTAVVSQGCRQGGPLSITPGSRTSWHPHPTQTQPREQKPTDLTPTRRSYCAAVSRIAYHHFWLRILTSLGWSFFSVYDTSRTILYTRNTCPLHTETSFPSLYCSDLLMYNYLPQNICVQFQKDYFRIFEWTLQLA